MGNPLDTLKENRNRILFIELAGLLHDIGKLSETFLRYRQTWHHDPQGWWKDPHAERKWIDPNTSQKIEERYLDDNEILKSLIPNEFKTKIKTVSGYDFGEPDFSIQKAIHDHHKDDNDIGNITKTLKAADGKDAAIDRNNPLFSAEQKDTIHKSNVFGFEAGQVITYESQEEARKKLYGVLKAELADYFVNFGSDCRQRLLNAIKEAFNQGLSDTTRPQNDTSLWEHAYAVASILKVLAIHNLFNKGNEIYKFEDVKFGIFGIGWDGLKFISYGQKIGDIVGRKNVLEKVKKSIKDIIEFKFPVGNTIYEDDDGIYFIVPVNFDKSQYSSMKNAVMREIYEAAAYESCGELQPHVVAISETDTIISLVKAIRDMRKKASTRFCSGEEGFAYFSNSLKDFETGKTVCPICRLRAVEREDVSDKICSACKDRRIRAAPKRTNGDPQTVFIDEIVDEHRRAALIVARFGLCDWLGGKMVRSLFVTEAKGIEKEIKSLGSIASFQVNDEEKLRSCFDEGTQYNYSRIAEDINSFSPRSDNRQRARKTAFLYAYGRKDIVNADDETISTIWKGWEGLLASAKKEIDDPNTEDILLYNILNAKSPTPSTILDVWTTTLRFFKREVSQVMLRALFPQSNRLRIETKDDIVRWDSGTLEAELIYKTGKKKGVEILFKATREVEVIGEHYTQNSVKPCDVAYVKITDKNYEAVGKVLTVEDCTPGDPIVSYRVITESPNIYMVIVPANMALDVTNLIYGKYIEQFGKVMGRLPLSIGNIFFRSKMPMFVVLDSGKKMLGNFERLASNNNKVFFNVKNVDRTSGHVSFHLDALLGGDTYWRTIQWNLPSKLGNCGEDYYHSYFIVDSNNADMSVRSTFFKTVAGDVVHFTEIKDSDTLCLQPNYYDFEFLDPNIRRHKIGIDTDLRRKSSVSDFKSKPLLLDELDQKVMHIWNRLIQGKQLPGVTDTKLRNLQSLWLTKYQEWKVDLDRPETDNFRTWMRFVGTSIRKEFPNMTEQTSEFLLETIKNGVFFDTLELCLSILKLRVEP